MKDVLSKKYMKPLQDRLAKIPTLQPQQGIWIPMDEWMPQVAHCHDNAFNVHDRNSDLVPVGGWLHDGTYMAAHTVSYSVKTNRYFDYTPPYLGRFFLPHFETTPIAQKHLDEYDYLLVRTNNKVVVIKTGELLGQREFTKRSGLYFVRL